MNIGTNDNSIVMFLVFSDCDTEWQDCIEADERYLVEEADFYKESGLSNRCVQEQDLCSISPYPGCDLSKKSSNSIVNDNTYVNNHRYRRQEVPCREEKCGCDGQCISVSRVLRSTDDRRMILRIDRITDWRNVNKQPIKLKQFFQYAYLNNDFETIVG